ncbi:tetraspanin-18-like isoform X1 [Lineus longissimus]|uniref:tetraspanin-18-like isoform X1 n=1 Tax=Lineus longissimus TaxID=88925 RepID=UPI00315DC8EC
MGLSCGLKLAKYFLFIFNIIFFLVGAVLLGVGIWVVVDNTYLMAFINNFNTGGVNVGGLLSSSAYVLIAFGAFIFVVGFLGCCGAWKESKCLLGIYSVIVGIILLVEIVAVILAAVYYDQTKKEMAAYLNLTIIDKYYGTPFSSEPLSLAWDFLHITAVSLAKTFLLSTIYTEYDGTANSANAVSLAWDYAQITFSCCGLDNYTDFDSATNWNKTSAAGSMVIPPSCCKVQDASTFPTFTLTDTNCPYSPSTTNSNYQTTCYASLMSYVQTYSIAIIAVTSSVAVLQLIVIIAACCLCRAIGGDSDTRA